MKLHLRRHPPRLSSFPYPLRNWQQSLLRLFLESASDPPLVESPSKPKTSDISRLRTESRAKVQAAGGKFDTSPSDHGSGWDMSLPHSATNKRKRGAIATKVKTKEARTAKSTLLICSLPRLNLPSLWQPGPYRGQYGGQYGGQHGAQNGHRPGPSTVLSTVATTLRKTIMKVKLRNTLIEARRGDLMLLEKILYLLAS
jgi:hypothetical protein